MSQTRFYLLMCGVVVVSIAGTLMTQGSGVAQSFWGLSGLSALLGVLWRAYRQELAYDRSQRQAELEHERASLREARTRATNVGMASHMANITFDKHVEFSEKYVARVHQGIQEGWRDGASEEALMFADDLSALRTEYAAWLPDGIQSKLFTFEKELRQIGAGARLLESRALKERRKAFADQLHRKFEIVIGAQDPSSDEEAGLVANNVIRYLRSVMGIRELTELRQRVLTRAMEALGPPAAEG